MSSLQTTHGAGRRRHLLKSTDRLIEIEPLDRFGPTPARAMLDREINRTFRRGPERASVTLAAFPGVDQSRAGCRCTEAERSARRPRRSTPRR